MRFFFSLNLLRWYYGPIGPKFGPSRYPSVLPNRFTFNELDRFSLALQIYRSFLQIYTEQTMSNFLYPKCWSSPESAPFVWSPNHSLNLCNSFAFPVLESDRSPELVQRSSPSCAFPNMESPKGGSERDKPPNSSSSASPVSVVSSFWQGNSLIVNRTIFQFDAFIGRFGFDY